MSSSFTSMSRWPANGEAEIEASGLDLREGDPNHIVEIVVVPPNPSGSMIKTRQKGEGNVVYLCPEALGNLAEYAESTDLRIRQVGSHAPGVYVLWSPVAMGNPLMHWSGDHATDLLCGIDVQRASARGDQWCSTHETFHAAPRRCPKCTERLMGNQILGVGALLVSP
jgi:hypothetical protein